MDLSSFKSTVFGKGFSHWDSQKIGALEPDESKVFDEALNKMGELSSQAQQLSTPLTTADKLREREDTVYIICDQTGAILQGFLRLGRKHLFLYPPGDGSMCEEDVPCLLDFYVHESVQRMGIGLDLFTSALKKEGLKSTEIAYDRPSPKLRPFLSKHYGLKNCLDQPNRFMVFKEYFGAPSTRSNLAG